MIRCFAEPSSQKVRFISLHDILLFKLCIYAFNILKQYKPITMQLLCFITKFAIFIEFRLNFFLRVVAVAQEVEVHTLGLVVWSSAQFIRWNRALIILDISQSQSGAVILVPMIVSLLNISLCRTAVHIYVCTVLMLMCCRTKPCDFTDTAGHQT